MKKGFTLVEIVIVIAIISIMAAVLIPIFTNVYKNEKQNIIDIYNGTTIKAYLGEVLIYEGSYEEMPKFDYKLIDVKVEGNVTILFFKEKGE